MQKNERSSTKIRKENEWMEFDFIPATIPTGYIHIGIIAGKLNGQTPAHTPKYEWEKTETNISKNGKKKL